MIARLITASMLASGSVSALAQAAPQGTGETARAMWPHMHQCTIAAAGRLAIKTKGTSAHRSSLASDRGEWSRIDLQFAGSPGSGGGPAITAHAINTKGTGANTGRATMADRNPIGVDCVASVTGDSAAQKATLSSFAYMRADGGGLGWSCSVSGSEDRPVFRIGLLVPTILGQAESPLGKAAGYSLSGHGNQVSIVRRGVEHSDSWHVACSSKEPRNTNYYLAVLKKA